MLYGVGHNEPSGGLRVRCVEWGTTSHLEACGYVVWSGAQRAIWRSAGMLYGVGHNEPSGGLRVCCVEWGTTSHLEVCGYVVWSGAQRAIWRSVGMLYGVEHNEHNELCFRCNRLGLHAFGITLGEFTTKFMSVLQVS